MSPVLSLTSCPPGPTALSQFRVGLCWQNRPLFLLWERQGSQFCPAAIQIPAGLHWPPLASGWGGDEERAEGECGHTQAAGKTTSGHRPLFPRVLGLSSCFPLCHLLVHLPSTFMTGVPASPALFFLVFPARGRRLTQVNTRGWGWQGAQSSSERRKWLIPSYLISMVQLTKHFSRDHLN